MLCCVSALEYPISGSRHIGLNCLEQGIHVAPWNYGTDGLTVLRRALHTQHVFQK